MKNARHWEWQKWWIISYAIGLTLVPVIPIHDRLIFAAEWLLIPLLIGVIFLGKNIQVPSKPLLCVWVGCTLTFVAGLFRGDLANKISIYDLGLFKYFSIRDDGIVFLRTIILFSTPWLVRNILKKDKAEYLRLFFGAFKICMLISAILAILDQRALGLINLKNWGYLSSDYAFWNARARGTFNTPIDASFMYGVTVVYLLTGPESLIKKPFNLIVLLFTSVAMLLTHGGTAILGLLVSGLAFLVLNRSFKKRDAYLVFIFAVFAVLLSTLILPRNFLAGKSLDFLYRVKTYRNYLSVVPSNPWLFFIGIGFSRLCADNNLILLFIQGGILYFVAVLNWVRVLLLSIPKSFVFIFLFWMITWLSFDTMGYWGIGRFCWFLFGLIEV